MSQPMQQQPSRTDPLFGPIGKSAQSGSTGSSTGGYSGGGYSGNANSRSTTGGSTGGLSGSSGNAQAQQAQGGYGTPPSYPPSYVVVIHDPQTGDRVFGPFATSIDAYAASARYHQRYLYGSHMTTTLILVEDPTSIP